MAGPDYVVEIAGLQQPAPPHSNVSNRLRDRPWVSVRWNCCGVYSRVYRNAAATAYEGRCPRCTAPVRAAIGPGGTSSRVFEAG